LIHNAEVKNRVASIGHDDDKRQSDYGYRKQIQKEALNLPLFPTTTIGFLRRRLSFRYVKPPIIYGDISRPKPMTVHWASFATSLTKKLVKKMLTGPVTILQWSLVRNDQPREDTCKQIAMAIRYEVDDLERAGIQLIKIDEPAIREGLPLRKSDWQSYLGWAEKAFRLSASGFRVEIQMIHTYAILNSTILFKI
jgi:methionine synthase II (cobalamin-independent)